MKLKTKLIIILLSTIINLICLPALIIRLSDGTSMGFSFLLFFAICPILEISLGIIAGTDIKKLFFVPMIVAFLFPFCYAITIGIIIWELFIYSIMYAISGTLVMLATYYFLKHKKEKKEN